MTYWLPAIAGLCAFLLALVLVPLVREIARRVGLVDKPDQHRKLHNSSIPLSGGIAIALVAGITGFFTFLVPSLTRHIFLGNPRELTGMIGGLLIVSAVGIWDDAFRLRARYKLLGQIAGAAVVASSGIVINRIGLGSMTWEFGGLAVPVTIFWLVLCMNALNLIDGADGLAATVSLILFGTIAAIALTLDNEVTAFVALVMCGALLGFLVFNFPPASVFLGDCGSLMIGLLAGSLAIHSCTKGAAAFAITAPLAMWVLPIMDVAMAFLRRQLTGRGLSTTDRLHLHHCLLNRGLTNKQLLAATSALACISGFGAWLTVRFHNQWFAVLTAGAVVLFLVGSRLFGHVEMRLAGQHLNRFRRTMFAGTQTPSRKGWSMQVRMQGNGGWDELWSYLTETADALNLHRIRLDLNIPWQHEAFHATWQRPGTVRQEELIRLEIPLLVAERRVGVASFLSDGGTEQAAWLVKFAEFLVDFQDRLDGTDPNDPTSMHHEMEANGAFAAQGTITTPEKSVLR